MPDSSLPARDILDRPKLSAKSGAAGSRSRLMAVVVGIDQYATENEPSAIRGLSCAANDAETVAGIIRQSHPAADLDLVLLTSPARKGSAATPTRAAVLQTLRRVADVAGPEDTVLFYFAGHGGMLGGRPSLFPVDVRLTADGSGVQEDSMLEVGELQALFEACPCPRRVMFLDCCQNAFAATARAPGERDRSLSANFRALPWRTGMPVSEGLVQALRVLPHGWSVLLSCGPNELSLEDPDVGEHGIFSHFLAEGLSGQADLDRDGVVSLAELAQYLGRRVTRQAQAVIEEEQEKSDSAPDDRGNEPAVNQRGQTPTLFWAGPADFPLTRLVAGGRREFQREVFPLARRYVFGRLPYPLPLVDMMRYGMGALWGLAMSLSVLAFLPFPLTAGAIVWAVTIGLLTGGLWLLMVALAAAANEVGWHAGGYAAGTAAVGWHVVVWGATVALAVAGAGWPEVAAGAFPLAAALAVLLSLVMIFGCNEVHSAIVLGDLVKRDERVMLRRAFRHLDQRWFQARLENRLAMVSAHPLVYQLLGLALGLAILAHGISVWFSGPLETGAAFSLARDFVLIVLVFWQAQWYPAAYHGLYRVVVPDK
jgi:uncharacterized caspase-like protein